jgi:SAM-dependent methyltransferase
MTSMIATTDTTSTAEISFYVCPTCGGFLRTGDDTLHCETCSGKFPIRDGIAEFLFEELSQSPDPVLRRMTAIDRIAPIYESKLWYPIVLSIYGGLGGISFPQLISTVARNMSSVAGRVLDVACGPGTYGRRVAHEVKGVWGIDISKRMLRQGLAYTAKEGITNMQFARARVEAMPFASECFDGVLCCGSLHLFADTEAALREIARVTKPGAILSGFTFTAGDTGILKYRRIRDWSAAQHGLHIFELAEINRLLKGTGFERFEPEVFGSVLTFKACKQVL